MEKTAKNVKIYIIINLLLNEAMNTGEFIRKEGKRKVERMGESMK